MALLAAMREAGVRKLVFSSTAATYGEPERTRSSSAPTTTSPYGASKLAVDPRRRRARRRPTDWARCRCATSTWPAPTGRRASATTPSRTSSRSSSSRARGGGRRSPSSATTTPTPDGTCVRDYVHVADLAEAHLLAVEAATAGEHLHLQSRQRQRFLRPRGHRDRPPGHGAPDPRGHGPAPGRGPGRARRPRRRPRERLGWNPSRADLAGIVADAWAFATEQGAVGNSVGVREGFGAVRGRTGRRLGRRRGGST